VVIVEPDALAAGCVPARHVKHAVHRLAQQRRARVYVDAGHSNWQPAATMARRLRRAGIRHADGFALNVSNLQRTKALSRYGNGLSRRVGKPFVIDTGRNGQGPWDGREEWCNPPGRGLGARPTTRTNHPRVDAFLWIKPPGESDGECANGRGQPAGEWWPEYALGLAQRAEPPLR
jgi:endoglucanase